MFQLEQNLQDWAKRFGPTLAMRTSDIEELEQHVRDSIAALKTKGLDDEEAFLVATHRVGQVGTLEREFAKINCGRIQGHHIFWMIAGVLFFEVWRFFINAAASLSEALTASAGGGGSAIGWLSVAITGLFWLGLALWIYRTTLNKSGTHSIDRFLVQPRGIVFGIAIVLFALISAIVKFGSQIVLVRMAPLADIGRATTIISGGNAFFTFLLPLVFLFVWLSIRVRMRHTLFSEA